MQSFASVVQGMLASMRATSVSYRLAHGTFWTLAGQVALRVSALAASIAVAQLLGVKGFGELGIIQSTVGMFGVFASFGLGTTATKFVAEYRGKDPAKAGRILALSNLTAVATGAAMALVLVMGGPLLASSSLAAPHLGGLLQIAAGFLFLSAINGAQMGGLAGLEAFRITARVNLLAGIISFPLMLSCAYLAGVAGAVVGLVMSMCATCFLSHMAIRESTRDAGIMLSYADCWRERSVLLRFSLPSLLAGALVGPVNWLCNTLLVNQPGGYNEMGILNAVNQWFTVIVFLPGVLGQVLLPILSESMNSQDSYPSRKVLLLSLKINAIITIPLILVTSVLSPWIMAAYGSSFATAWPVMILALLTSGILALLMPIGQVIVAGGRIWTGFAMNFGWAVAFFGMTYMLVDEGALGVATARLFAYLLHAVWTIAYAVRMYRCGLEEKA